MMAEFHFLRPWWLLLLPLALWLGWRIASGHGGASGWRAVVDKVLQPYVLSDGDGMSERRWPLWAALAAAVIAAVALAGPTWERLPVPAYRSDEALVVALDLSRSMDATDVEPTRLARARLKLLDLLERRAGGQTALVVFTSNAFTVTPLTTDTQTIGSLVNALGTDIMPSRGSLLEVGIEKSAELLRQAGATGGEILLITDATASPDAFSLVGSLRADGILTSVLAVGTEAGAPIPAIGGGFLTDSRGQVVVPQLNADNLDRLARAGGGRFARLVAGDTDLDRLFPRDLLGNIASAVTDDEGEADIWRDQGIWLTLLLLPIVALGFRRGWVYLLVAGLWLPPPAAQAFDWSDLWLRRDQQGMRALEQDGPAEAADLFNDPEWRGVAHYQAGDYTASAAALFDVDTPDGNYNRGNALARAGRLAEAIDAYDRALELDPEHADAEFNRELVADLLEQQQEQQDQQSQDQSQPEPGSESESDEGQQQGEDESEGSGTSEQQQASNDAQDSGTDDAEPEDGESPEPDAEDEPDGEEPGQEEQQSLQAAATPQEVEDWASEQAADQWLRRIPQDPGGLLRRKFLYQYQQLGVDQDGNSIYPGTAAEPW